jgi:electron transfer flavoprotein alpha subunit
VSVLVLVEVAGGAADDVSRQAATLARGYAEAAGTDLDAILIGPGAAGAAAGLGDLGISAVHVADDDRLESFAPQAWGRIIAGLAGRLTRRRSPACRWPRTASRRPPAIRLP